ncbi:MAG: hypothetical protein HY243_12280 [Proteobacteria bacterium]|nr:hypothetical protein [Pseudomonadota bacterium]
MDSLDKSKIRRGLILQALRLEIEGLTDITLLAFLQGSRDPVTKTELRGELDYLAGKGKEFVEIIERTSRMWVVRISPAGIDLLDENPRDNPGVTVGR